MLFGVHTKLQMDFITRVNSDGCSLPGTLCLVSSWKSTVMGWWCLPWTRRGSIYSIHSLSDVIVFNVTFFLFFFKLKCGWFTVIQVYTTKWFYVCIPIMYISWSYLYHNHIGDTLWCIWYIIIIYVILYIIYMFFFIFSSIISYYKLMSFLCYIGNS